MSDIAHNAVTLRAVRAGEYGRLREIFWETAFQTEFDTREAEAGYEYKYLRWYWEKARDLLFVAEGESARDGAERSTPVADVRASLSPTASHTVLGYICGVEDTRAHPDLAAAAAHIPLFNDLYDRYPAHLHINLTANARGRGTGALLIARFVTAVAECGANGVHLVTGVHARNVSFYRRNGFTDAVERSGALFMGRSLR